MTACAVTVELDRTYVPRTEARDWPVEFDRLPLLVEGESKIVRAYGPGLVLEQFKPTVYSYTHNRSGTVPGTDLVRLRFSAETFAYLMRCDVADGLPRSAAFCGLVHDATGRLLMLQTRVALSNLEVRVKRFHIGSPVHRYRYTERYATREQGPPVERWTRFSEPVVCFDWRHPLADEHGQRLADEPLPDEYAALWIDDLNAARALARRTFLRLETRFAQAGLVLVDICLFIDRTGRCLYGEISPDCMRLRRAGLEDADALDKDQWRQGASPEALLARYQEVYDLVYGTPT